MAGSRDRRLNTVNAPILAKLRYRFKTISIKIPAGWLSWLEHHPIYQKVPGSSPVGAHVGSNPSMFLSSLSLPINQ